MTTDPVIQLELPADAAIPGISRAAQPDAMLSLCREHLVDVSEEERSAWTRCTATEAIYQPGRACRIAYELRDECSDRPVIVYARWPAEGDRHASATRIRAHGGAFDLFRYPRDRRLRPIRDLRREDWLKDASADWFGDLWGTGRWSNGDWRCTPIKYVPESRLVCRMKGLWTSTGGVEKWVRAYVRVSRIDTSVDQVSTLRAVKKALAQIGTPFDAPTPLASMPEYHLLATEFIRGTSLREQADAGNHDAVLDACGRIASLSRLREIWPMKALSMPNPLPHLMLSELTLAAPTLAAIARTLKDWAQTLPPLPVDLRPIHGDLHTGQIIQKGTQLFLVDWDRAALGDPTTDICNLAAELEFRRSLACQGSAEFVAREIIDAWRNGNGAFNPQSASWWFAYACVRRAWGLLRHLRPSWKESASWLLNRAHEVLRSRELETGR